MKVGFVGLGIMGKPMAGHIIKDGFETYLFDLNTSAVDELKVIGGHACTSNKEVVNNSDLFITMLPAGKQVSQVLFSDDGLAKNCKPGTIIIDMRSVSLEEANMFENKLEEYEVHCNDALVSGGDEMEHEGKVSNMGGGDKEHANEILPLFESIGE